MEIQEMKENAWRWRGENSRHEEQSRRLDRLRRMKK
jgi:hypothetical protein